MIVLDKIGIGESMSKSPKLFEQTWGEDVVSTIGTGIINFFVCLLIVLICLPLFVLGEITEVLGISLIFFGITVSVLFFQCVKPGIVPLCTTSLRLENYPLAQKYGIDFEFTCNGLTDESMGFCFKPIAMFRLNLSAIYGPFQRLPL